MQMHELKAQDTFKRAAEIAVTGNHGLHLAPLYHHGAYFDPEMIVNRPDLRAIWDRHEGQPWRLEAAEDEIALCNSVLRSLESSAGERLEPRRGLLSVAIQPLTWCDRVLPPPAEDHSIIAVRVLRSRFYLSLVDPVLNDAGALALLKGWQGYFVGVDPEPFVHVARTIAAMSGAKYIGRSHLAEAFSYAKR